MAKSSRRVNPAYGSTAARAILPLALLLALSANAAPVAVPGPLVRIKSGQLRGVARPTGGAEFLGIPYAQPPVGELRWHEPLPAKSWAGVRDAGTFGAPCAQPVLGAWNKHDAEASQEDCLFLNVITPEWPVKEPLPVMFWIHGGANAGGTASSSLYKDGTLVQHGVLLVTVNYRLGIFGFLAHQRLTAESPHHASGDYGLADQMLALEWVVDNIAKFGGDPHNITVFGQSAGAQDTSLLMTSPAKDLFQHAIAESGASLSPAPPTLAEAEQAGEQLADDLKAPESPGAIPYLRKIPAQDLLHKLAALAPEQRPHMGPVIDGWVIPLSPAEVFVSGQEAPIPLLFGTTTREFGMEATTNELRTMLFSLDAESAGRTLASYGLSDGDGTTDPKYGTPADQWAADTNFRCPSTAQGFWHSAHHPTYEYEFNHAIPGQEAQGAVHSSDLPYVFGYFPKSGNISGHFGDVDTKLADLMETYWTNFAKTGNPNGDNVPKWPEFDGTQALIEFGEDGQVSSSAALRTRQCSIYREAIETRLLRAAANQAPAPQVIIPLLPQKPKPAPATPGETPKPSDAAKPKPEQPQ
jgi:para-nitrobenzyl esterase